MSKRNIVIAGGGFAGTSALRRLRGYKGLRKTHDIILVDEKDSFEFLPMLPDLIGGWIGEERLRVDLKARARAPGCRFEKGTIETIDPERRIVVLKEKEIEYEYLIMATGSKTNFFRDEKAERTCFKLDSIADALSIRNELLRRGEGSRAVNVVIVGGGYTGIEIATQSRALLASRGVNHRIHVIEKADDIMGMLPRWIREEVRAELKKAGIEIHSPDALKGCDGQTAVLASGLEIKNALCIWSAGVKTPAYIERIDVPREKTRVTVDEHLKIAGRAYDTVFAAGDTASFSDRKSGKPLRMAIMFSMAQGVVAARNVARTIFKKPLAKYHPLDLGYLIPMAHGKAPGMVLGRRVHGRPGFLLHYGMCVYRSAWRNRPGMLADLSKKLLSRT
jgi:NADH dehydrogenase